MKIGSLFFILMLFARATAYGQFHIDTLAQAPEISFPVVLAFPPDGNNRLFFTEKNSGKVRIIQNDSLLAEPFLTVSVRSYGEQGLLGLTFHPQYPDSPFVYIYYTRPPDSANVLARYTDSSGIGVHPQQLMVIPRQFNTPSHNGGNIHFGPDDKLYVTVGDYYYSNNGQDTSNTNKRGKIHRLNPDGSIPSDNPFPGNSIYVYGCRNSFDFTFDKLTGKMYATENGPNCNDEINYIVAGGNYGWPVDGNCQYINSPLYRKPMYYWQFPPSVTGITVYRDTVFPRLYGKLLVGSYNLGKMFQFGLNENGDSVSTPPQNLAFIGSSVIDIEVGPDGNIYLANSTFGGISRILRLRKAIIIPQVPPLYSPANNVVNQAVQFTASWGRAVEAEFYDIQVATEPGFTNIVFEDTISVDTTAWVQNLAYSTQYYWRVRARNDVGASEYSEPRTFTTVIPPPAAPALLYPEDSTENQPRSSTFVWRTSPTAESYSLQVATNENFNPVGYSFSSLAETTKTINSLAGATKYYWRVNAKNIGGTGAYSDVRIFTTVPPLPSPVVLVLPLDSATEQPLNITFQWDSLAYAESYHIQVSSDAAFTLILQEDSTLTQPTYALDSLLCNAPYYWRVRAKNFSGIGAWSSTRTFETIRILCRVSSGWNLVSLPINAIETSKEALFPSAISYAFLYDEASGYVNVGTLLTGRGYWLKFDSAEEFSPPGRFIEQDTIDIKEGWNLVGSVSDTVSTSSVQSIPPGIVTPSFFGFENGYNESTAILPGKGYWVKSHAAGKLILSAAFRNKISNSVLKVK